MSRRIINLLIIDDNEDDRRIYKRYLKKNANYKFEVYESANGKEAMETFKNNKNIDCILTDYLLPDTDGVSLIEKMEKASDKKNLPIVAITGEGTEDIAANFIKSGAKEYLRKDDISDLSLINAIVSAIDIANLNQKVLEQQEEIISKNKELETVNAYLQDFCHTVSHDLKEPLTLIQSFLGILLKSLESGNDIGLSQKEILERVMHSSERMRNLITDLLSYAENTKKSDQTLVIDLNAILTEVQQDLELKIQNSQATINISPLPKIKGNRSQIYQVFLNIVSNALKFREEGSKPLINISNEQTGNDSLKITISDNGIGIDQKHLDRIFKPFNRLHSKDKFEGSGVGLATVCKIIENHGGSIAADSKLGEGTTFTITLNNLKE